MLFASVVASMMNFPSLFNLNVSQSIFGSSHLIPAVFDTLPLSSLYHNQAQALVYIVDLYFTQRSYARYFCRSW